MACIKTRGPKNARRFYVNYDIGRTAEGKRVQRMHLLKGVQDLKQARQELARVERDLAAGKDPFADVRAPEAMKELLERWRDGLTNRNADDDRSRIDRHLVPKFGSMLLDAVTLPVVMDWVDELAATELSAQSQRHALNTLSRFFSWAIERGLATVNPVKMVPQGKRPVGAKTDAPWLEDDSKVAELVKELGGDVGLMFYLANGSGMRLGEVCGLRINDLDFLHEGIIRVAHSYGGCLKEDKRSEGKVKFVPAPHDAEAKLKAQIARRKLQGAVGDDLLFPFTPAKPQNRRRTSTWTGYRKEYVEARWEEVTRGDEKRVEGVDHLTWYQATRHTFVSRNLKAGVSLDEVSAAVGHSSPMVTKRHYDHYVRRSYSNALRGLN
jgi:integrase